MRGGPSPAIVGEAVPAAAARWARTAAVALQFVSSRAETLPMKSAVVAACERGEFEAGVRLPDAQLVSAGASSNNATFLVEHLHGRELSDWAEAVRHAVHAGYDVRPSWCPLERGAGCDGLLLSWSMAVDDPPTPPQLMAAATAYRMALAARAHHRWVEQAHDAVRRAAVKGASSCTVHDATPAEAPAWARRRELLASSGFTTELLAAHGGASLLIRW